MAANEHEEHAKRWRVKPGSKFRLADVDTHSKAGAPGNKGTTTKVVDGLVAQLGEWQTRLWAESSRSLLMVLQAMDAGGKDGTIRKVFTGVNPQGVRVASFKAPTAHELAHDFLWRIHRETPGKGEIGVFNRSHYEDVLVVRVDELVRDSVASGTTRSAVRVDARCFGTTVVSSSYISKEGAAPGAPRRPGKHWDSQRTSPCCTDDYQVRVEAIRETSTDDAPCA